MESPTSTIFLRKPKLPWVVVKEIFCVLKSLNFGFKTMVPPKPTPKVLAAGPLCISAEEIVLSSIFSIVELPLPSVSGISP